METAQQGELHRHRLAWRPLDSMACSLDSFFGWDPQLFYVGEGAIRNVGSDSGVHERHELELLVKKSEMESLVSSEVSTAAVPGLPTAQTMATRTELDELLQSLWDSDEKGFSCCDAQEEESDVSFQYDHHFDLGTISATVPSTSPEKTLTSSQAELASSSSSQGSGDPHAKDISGARSQTVGANGCSSKRSTPEGKESNDGKSCKRSRSVLRPFAVVKPSAADGEVTLADINERILTPPARPVRHPVGEFACAPRVSAGNRPAPSGKTVAGFTRLRTAGRGTITIVRTRG